MTDLARRRQYFAEEIQAICGLRSAALVEALATVPRERFLGPGPWTIVTESGPMAVAGAPAVRSTPDDDPRHVYHNVGVAIDPARQLFNGQPALLASLIDALTLSAGRSVLHVGAGLGYYTAIMAHCVGPGGRVIAYEVDDALAQAAQENLRPWPWVEVRSGDASQNIGASVDAMLVNAGVTHPLDHWLDALVPGGRMVLPLTARMAAMGPIGKGVVLVVTRQDAVRFAARVIGFVAIYSAIGVRDDDVNAKLGTALMGGPGAWQGITTLRRDTHELRSSCWLHGSSFCISSEVSSPA